jgi:hypothetical protein
MREHGIPMDDPQVSGGANGPIAISIGGPGNDTEKLQAAQEACQSILPDGGPDFSVGGSASDKGPSTTTGG